MNAEKREKTAVELMIECGLNNTDVNRLNGAMMLCNAYGPVYEYAHYESVATIALQRVTESSGTERALCQMIYEFAERAREHAYKRMSSNLLLAVDNAIDVYDTDCEIGDGLDL